MIVLGIDPGTARSGYGIVSREGSALRMLDYCCLETIDDRPLAARLLLIHFTARNVAVDLIKAVEIFAFRLAQLLELTFELFALLLGLRLFQFGDQFGDFVIDHFLTLSQFLDLAQRLLGCLG